MKLHTRMLTSQFAYAPLPPPKRKPYTATWYQKHKPDLGAVDAAEPVGNGWWKCSKGVSCDDGQKIINGGHNAFAKWVGGPSGGRFTMPQLETNDGLDSRSV